MKLNNSPTILISLAFIITFSLSGCEHFDRSAYIEKSKMEASLDKLARDKQLDLDIAIKKIEKAKDEQLNQVNSNFQATSNELFAAKIALDVESIKSRPVLIADSHVNGAIAFAPKPTLESVLANQELLKKELDIEKTTNADIAARLEATKAVAGKAQEQLKEKALAIETAIADKEKITSEYTTKIDAAQQELNKINSKVIAAQDENLKDKAERAKERMWLVGIFTFVGIALGVAAIFSPILKHQFMLASGSALAIGIGIVLVPQWVVTTFACTVFVTLFCWALYEILLSHKAASNTYRALQEVKVDDAETYDKIKPILASWQSKYTKDGSTIENTATVNHIDKVLKSSDSL